MQEEVLKAYQGLKKHGEFLIKSSKYRLVVVYTKLPNLIVTLPFRVAVTSVEYHNCRSCIPELYSGPNIREQP
jgi:hypothetical protein